MVTEEHRTAHHLRRLQASVHELQNALCVANKAEVPRRPSREVLSAETNANKDPYSRIRANNSRGVIEDIERLEEVGIVVIGLQGVGALTLDALCRYGVKHLIIADNSEITMADLDFMTYQVQHLGRRRDDHLATSLQSLNPDVDVLALGLPTSNVTGITNALRTILSLSGENDNSEEDPDDLSSILEENQVSPTSKDSDDDDPEDFIQVVVLCGPHPELALALNELCCEFGLHFVYVSTGRNGITGDIISVVPGRTACLQCLEKRKLLRVMSPPQTPSDSAKPTEVSRPRFRPSLPMVECILAGIAVQQIVGHALSCAPLCSRVEYDGFLEELDRSGLVAPVHQCANSHCRSQQQQQQAAPSAER